MSRPSSSASPSLPLWLALLGAALLVSLLPSASAQAGCYPCVVSSCAGYFNGTSLNVSIGATSPALAAAECSTLNTDIGVFIATAQSPACAGTVAQLACQVIATVNQTEVACNTSTIGVGTPLGNVTYFQQRCASAVSCLGYVFQDEVYAAQACNSFNSFLGAVIAQPTPSSLPCAPCPISACYNLSTIGVTNVTFWAGSLPGINGLACPGQQAVAATLLASGAPGVPPSLVQQAVCNPLAALSQLDTQAACNAGQVDSLFDGILFTAAGNTTWQAYCQQSISQLFNATIATRLLNAGYCVSPSAGLTSYAVQYLLPNSAAPSSSSSSPFPSPASSSSASPSPSPSSSSPSPSTTASASVVLLSSPASAAVVVLPSSSTAAPAALASAAAAGAALHLPAAAVALLVLSSLLLWL